MNTKNIAIDGPAGAGKSTIAKRVAEKLNIIYVDTGALYRALAYHVLQSKVNADDEAAVETACRPVAIDLRFSDGRQLIYLNGEDVTSFLRTEEVGNTASRVSAYPYIREKLLDLQRILARENDVVMDGRDIGTNVLPDAGLKIFLTASVDTRAERRFEELKQKGEHPDLDVIKQDIENRDTADRTREHAPLRQAEDAVLIDSSDMTIEEVTENILALIKERF